MLDDNVRLSVTDFVPGINNLGLNDDVHDCSTVDPLRNSNCTFQFSYVGAIPILLQFNVSANALPAANVEEIVPDFTSNRYPLDLDAVITLPCIQLCVYSAKFP